VGFGLGLSISKRIIEKHNGTINVQSKVKEGTWVTLELPAVAQRKG
jgi:signal transduction histidine kinase